jgi:uncharacterized protein (TIGR00369 family)
MMAKISIEQFNEIATERLPFAQLMGFDIEQLTLDEVRMRARYNDTFLRPGGTIAGPVMMGLADAAMYALVLAHAGPVELAVTTSLNINFLRKPDAGDMLATARPLKIGKRLAIGEISLYSADADDIVVAHATATYSIPPQS